MNYEDVLGLKHLKSHLQTTIKNRRVAHAQLFVGQHGYGVLPLAIAFANNLITSYSTSAQTYPILAHPDLHFVYPINATSDTSTKPISTDFINDWRSFLKHSPYQSLYDWYQHIGIEKKQGLIKVNEAQDMLKKLSLKSFTGGVKVMIIWCADLMNIQTANKLLKLIEEPPKDTFFILTTSQPDAILETIKSRCQAIHFPPLSEAHIAEALVQRDLASSKAKSIAHQADGDFVKALHLSTSDTEEAQFEEWFITWVRTAFRAKGNKSVVLDLMHWSDTLATQTRELQKRFIDYCIQFFRQAMLQNYKAHELVFFQPLDSGFKFEGFSKFIHGQNMPLLFESLSNAAYYIERNANAKMIFTDLSLELTRLLHKKS